MTKERESGFRDPALVRRISCLIDRESRGLPETRLMEVCGSHTQAVERFGLRRLMPKNIKLISGPGCPVCVTPPREIDEAVSLAKDGHIITTYGDLARVPSGSGSLMEAKAEGADVRIVYSVSEAGEIALANRDKTVVHVAIGFETTAQTTAAFLASSPSDNLLMLNCHRWFLPAMKALLKTGEVKIDGYICPGHVSTLIGSNAYAPLSREYGIPQVVAGFEPVDVMLSVLMLTRMVKRGKAGVENEYARVVKPEGNPKAMRLMNLAFGAGDAEWRGLGRISGSGMPFRERFAGRDARFILKPKTAGEKGMPRGCLCANVLMGKTEPERCPMFGKACTPEKPIGPCMVSVEGACHNAFRYR